MIQSTSSSNGPLRPDSVPASSTRFPFPKVGADHLSADKTSLVRSVLSRQMEIRPEVVERGRVLAADPAYPSVDIIRRVAELIVRSPDLTDESA